jgi:hypothetical protein
MASFANTTQTNIVKLLFQAVGWANIADNTATSPATVLYISLHNADPGEAGNQGTNETTYTNYARVAVARSSGGFTVSGTSPAVVSNGGAVNFPQCGITGDTLTHFGVGLASSGAGTLIGSGPVGSGPALEFTATFASPSQLTVPNSAFVVNNRVSLYPTQTGTLPSGITEGLVYFIGTVAGLVVTLSTTSANGNPVNTSSVGAGVIITQTPLLVSQNITPSFAIGALNAKLW